ncbi:MAG TPA: hypothetical protein VE057_20685 [Archangium sp.]|nr:hypothetical protein [Archangium sp.]
MYGRYGAALLVPGASPAKEPASKAPARTERLPILENLAYAVEHLNDESL